MAYRSASQRPDSRYVQKASSFVSASSPVAGVLNSRTTIQKQPRPTPSYVAFSPSQKHNEALYSAQSLATGNSRKSTDPSGRKPQVVKTDIPTVQARPSQPARSEVQRINVQHVKTYKEDKTRMPSRGTDSSDRSKPEVSSNPRRPPDSIRRAAEESAKSATQGKDDKKQFQSLLIPEGQIASKFRDSRVRAEQLTTSDAKAASYIAQVFTPTPVASKTTADIASMPADTALGLPKQDSGLLSHAAQVATTTLPNKPLRPPSATKRDSGDSSLASQSTIDTLHRPPSSKQLHFSSAGQSSLSTYSDSDPVRIVGLRNFGNICFMNAIIQCLNFAPQFEWTLQQSRSDLNSSSKTRGALFDAVLEVLTDLRSGRKTSVSVMSVKTIISTVASQFNSYDQHDAHEFLRFLLDALHEDLNRNRSKHPSVKLARTTSESRKLSDLSEEWWQDSIKRGSSCITDLFQGQLLNILTCTVCHNSSYTFDVFLDLSVPVPASDLSRYSLSSATLQQCLDEFTSEKELEGVKCKHCKAVRVCKTRMIIYRFPKILVIHLKRFAVTTYSEVKINTSVACPMLKLDLSRYSQLSKHESAAHPLYNLHGIAHHFGDVDFGHYYA